MSNRSSHELDMVNGSILPKLLIFALPLAGSSILQLLFNAADVVVLGRYVGSNALAAVGSTGSLTSLIVNLFIGISIGVNVIISNTYAAGKYEEVSEIVHTSIATSVVCGAFLVIVGFIVIEPMLHLMGFPEEVLPLSRQYLLIYFCGMPFIMLYNFGAAIMRSVGDTKRSLIYLTIAGVTNVILNLFFVIVLKMGVAGVALATTISNGISAGLVTRALIMEDSCLHLDLKKLNLNRNTVFKIAKIGIPAGLQSVCFSLSNVIIQSSINSFGAVVMAGNSAAANLEGFYYAAMHSIYNASITFTGQNYGARKYSRINKVYLNAILALAIIAAIFSPLFYFAGPQLLSLYNTDPQVIQAGMIRMTVFACTYYICGLMDVSSGISRGLGYGLPPTLISLGGSVAFRIIWVSTVFAATRDYMMLLIGYPISWALTSAAHYIFFRIVRRRFPKEDA